MATIVYGQSILNGILHSGRSSISRRGRRPRRGAPTPEVVTFRKFCMSKRKNLEPWRGGGVRQALDTLDPPMLQLPTFAANFPSNFQWV